MLQPHIVLLGPNPPWTRLQGIDWQGLYPFSALTLPSTRYSPQNFLLLDLHPDGSWVLPDLDKNRGGARCSDWWTYNGAARFQAESQPRDAGAAASVARP